MATRKEYKAHKRGGPGSFVMLTEQLQKSVAWATLKHGPRALYIEIKRRFKGTNNGRIILSHREAAALLNVHRNTVGPWFDELQRRGFIREMRGHCLGPSGIGETSHWALEEEPTDDMRTAPKSFLRWVPEQNPRTNSVHGRHKNCDAPNKVGRNRNAAVTNTVTPSG